MDAPILPVDIQFSPHALCVMRIAKKCQEASGQDVSLHMTTVSFLLSFV